VTSFDQHHGGRGPVPVPQVVEQAGQLDRSDNPALHDLGAATPFADRQAPGLYR
jgi:hypothetical protein